MSNKRGREASQDLSTPKSKKQRINDDFQVPQTETREILFRDENFEISSVWNDGTEEAWVR